MKTKSTAKRGRVRSSKLLSGVELIAAERQRQVSEERYSVLHDDQHDCREMARAALCYAEHYVARAWVFTNELEMPGVKDGPRDYRKEKPSDDWPWGKRIWNPQDPMRDLVKSGALIAAEIDRLQRKTAKAR